MVDNRGGTVWLKVSTFRQMKRRVMHYYGNLIPLSGESMKVTRILTSVDADKLNTLHEASGVGSYRA